LTFDAPSDVGKDATTCHFGLVWSLPEELRAALRSSNKVLQGRRRQLGAASDMRHRPRLPRRIGGD
jgi:hypothetical protein